WRGTAFGARQAAPSESGSGHQGGNHQIRLRRAEAGDVIVPHDRGTQRAATAVGSGDDVVVIPFGSGIEIELLVGELGLACRAAPGVGDGEQSGPLRSADTGAAPRGPA